MNPRRFALIAETLLATAFLTVAAGAFSVIAIMVQP